jgi:hypothetical protein
MSSSLSRLGGILLLELDVLLRRWRLVAERGEDDVREPRHHPRSARHALRGTENREIGYLAAEYANDGLLQRLRLQHMPEE